MNDSDPAGSTVAQPGQAAGIILITRRLVLRPFTLQDAPEVSRLVADRQIAATTLNIPYPYPPGNAEAWIGGHAARFAEGRGANFAVTSKSDGALMGSISLVIFPEHRHAEMGYWLGRQFWGQGFATEAARAVLDYGFETVGLHRIYAQHFGTNPASGRVMQKIGMTYEGRRREHVLKWDRFEDSVQYGILRSEWEERRGRQ